MNEALDKPSEQASQSNAIVTLEFLRALTKDLPGETPILLIDPEGGTPYNATQGWTYEDVRDGQPVVIVQGLGTP